MSTSAERRAVGRSACRAREDTAAAAAAAADEPGIFYASHVYNPFFLHGTKTYVFELWEQLGGQLPGTLVLPGNGTLVLGAYLGCKELLEQRLIDRIPVIVAVQAAFMTWASGAGRALAEFTARLALAKITRSPAGGTADEQGLTSARHCDPPLPT